MKQISFAALTTAEQRVVSAAISYQAACAEKEKRKVKNSKVRPIDGGCEADAAFDAAQGHFYQEVARSLNYRKCRVGTAG